VGYFVARSKIRILTAAAFALVTLLAFACGFFYWVTYPIRKITRYARKTVTNPDAVLPDLHRFRLGHTEMDEPGEALVDMRSKLQSREYLEQFLTGLAHELKNPTSSIQTAAMLIDDTTPAHERDTLLANIRGEARRVLEITDRMHELGRVENRTALKEKKPVAALFSRRQSGFLSPGPRVFFRQALVRGEVAGLVAFCIHRHAAEK
jgi:signal transduction histidine kinase